MARKLKANPSPNFNSILAAAESIAHEARKGQAGGYTSPEYFGEKVRTIQREVWSE